MTSEEIITFAIERFEKPLVSYARQITGDLESARDAVQETFLRLSLWKKTTVLGTKSILI